MLKILQQPLLAKAILVFFTKFCGTPNSLIGDSTTFGFIILTKDVDIKFLATLFMPWVLLMRNSGMESAWFGVFFIALRDYDVPTFVVFSGSMEELTEL